MLPPFRYRRKTKIHSPKTIISHAPCFFNLIFLHSKKPPHLFTLHRWRKKKNKTPRTSELPQIVRTVQFGAVHKSEEFFCARAIKKIFSAECLRDLNLTSHLIYKFKTFISDIDFYWICFACFHIKRCFLARHSPSNII